MEGSRLNLGREGEGGEGEGEGGTGGRGREGRAREGEGKWRGDVTINCSCTMYMYCIMYGQEKCLMSIINKINYTCTVHTCTCIYHALIHAGYYYMYMHAILIP